MTQRNFHCPESGEACVRGDCLLGFCLDADDGRMELGRRRFERQAASHGILTDQQIMREARAQAARDSAAFQVASSQASVRVAWADAMLAMLATRKR